MGSFNSYPNVFSPIQVGPVRLKNRIVFAPIVSAHAQSGTGEVTDGTVAFVAAQARGGVALVTLGSTPVDFERGRDFWTDISAVKDSDVPLLMRVSEAAHRYGAKISAELLHAGRVANPEVLGGKKAYVASLLPSMDPDRFEEIGERQIFQVIDGFCSAAKRLQRAGFDMILIHGAHGNLVSSFFSPVANHRTDKYGGSLENRMRFTLTLLEQLRATVGPNMGLELRISVHEYVEGCPTLEETTAFLVRAQEYLDGVHFSGGSIYSDTSGKYAEPSYMDARNQNVERAAAIHPHLSIPVTVVGNIPGIEDAEEIIRSGKADLVAMARNLIADMDLVKKAHLGKTEDIRPCLHCNFCSTFAIRGAELRCAVNPMVGQEHMLRRIEKADVKRKVMIVGGGPAGMTAAQTAAKRGHEVILFEAAEKLGGRLYEASAAKPKDYYRRYLDWTIRQTLQSGARVELGMGVTPELVGKEAPDALILAVGAHHVIPPIVGVHQAHVIDVSKADLRAEPIGKKVAVIGGGLSGTECAIDLAEEGHEVVIVDQLAEQELLTEVFATIRTTLKERIVENGIRCCYRTAAELIAASTVRVRDLDTGVAEEIPCDTVVLAVGLEPDEDWLRMMTDIIPETYQVGDCREVGDIFTANHEAFFMALEI
ncbi:MAG: FAD-dependent oxidoreductase [Thermoleophilia bacterium]|nr:FAD-dependent oxidoreductase [Thermoleophilia bacterium]